MNAAEHIIQSFFWRAESPKKLRGRFYLTMCNVIGGNGSEIDILAMSPDGVDKLRVESHVDVGWPIGEAYAEYLKRDCIRKKMLDDKHSRKLIEDDLGWQAHGYRKVLVVWQNPFDIQALRKDLGDETVDVWPITELLRELLSTVGGSNFQDDILRLMSMLSSMLSMESALRHSGAKRVSGWSVNGIDAVECTQSVARLACKFAEDSGRATVKDEHVRLALQTISQLCERSSPE